MALAQLSREPSELPSATDIRILEHGSADTISSGSGSDSGAEGDAEDEAERQAASRGGFLSGSKTASFAKSFSKILASSQKKQTDVPILAASKSYAKRKRDEEAKEKADRDAKRLRQGLKTRGHKVVTRKGVDPAQDAVERQLQRIATRGVVQLFNAVAKAQKQRNQALLTGLKDKASISKAAFFQELKGAGRKVVSHARVAGPALKAAAAADVGTAGAAANSPGWEVLRPGFTGLKGSGKMKDWDRRESSSDGEEVIAGETDSGGDDDDVDVSG